MSLSHGVGVMFGSLCSNAGDFKSSKVSGRRFLITWQTFRVHGVLFFSSAFYAGGCVVRRSCHRQIIVTSGCGFLSTVFINFMKWTELVLRWSWISSRAKYVSNRSEQTRIENLMWIELMVLMGWRVGMLVVVGVFFILGMGDFIIGGVQWGESTRCHKRGYILSWNEVWVGLGY